MSPSTPNSAILMRLITLFSCQRFFFKRAVGVTGVERFGFSIYHRAMKCSRRAALSVCTGDKNKIHFFLKAEVTLWKLMQNTKEHLLWTGCCISVFKVSLLFDETVKAKPTVPFRVNKA